MRLLGRLIDGLGSVAVALGALGVIAMTFLMTAGVFYRYVLKQPIVWADEAASYLLVFSVMLAVADVMKRGDNIRVDLFLDMFGNRGRYIIELAGLLTALVFAAALTWLGIEMVRFSADMGLTTAKKIDVPSWWVEIALPIGGLLLTLATVVRLGRFVSGAAIEDPGSHDAPAGSDRE